MPWWSDSCWPSLKKISLATKCSRSVVINAIKELKAAGLVETKPSFDDQGDQGSNIYTDQGSNIYTLFNPKGGSAVGDHPVRHANGGGHVHDHRGVAGNHEEDTLGEELLKKTTTPLSPQDPTFEAFWEKYPRKTAKEKARQAWMRLGVAPDAFEITRIMAAIEAQKAPGNTLNPTNGKVFIPHPATWLNGARWNDEIVAIAPPKFAGRPTFDMGDWEGRASA
jgi:DNA-binding transcriptional MocR family regulator